MDPFLVFVIIVGVLGLGMAWFFANFILKSDQGTDKMKEIALAIRQGAAAFLKRQYVTIGIITAVAAVLIFGLYFFTGKLDLGLKTAMAFILGAVIFGGMSDPERVPLDLVGFGFGASLVALFAQLGGGIYTKAADVGADLVGKVEAGIPEDDPRNPAVIADLVGDNVGDCAGRGADIFESNAAENIGAMILGVALYPVFGVAGVLFPLVALAFGIIASAIGIMAVISKETEEQMKALNRGCMVTIILSIIGFYIATKLMLDNIWFFWAGIVGIATSLAFVYITQYYTEYKYRPVKEIAEASKTGPATNIIAGLAVGLETTGLPVIVISLALFLSYTFGTGSGVPHGGLYGTAIATMGMLATAAYVLAMDTFGTPLTVPNVY